MMMMKTSEKIIWNEFDRKHRAALNRERNSSKRGSRFALYLTAKQLQLVWDAVVYYKNYTPFRTSMLAECDLLENVTKILNRAEKGRKFR